VAKHNTTSTVYAVDFSIFSTCSSKAITNYLCLKQNSLKEFPKQSFRTTVGLSMNMKYDCDAGYLWSILGKLKW